MTSKLFFETYPLYRKFKCAIPETIDRIPQPSINGVCSNCGTFETFNPEYGGWPGTIHEAPSAGQRLHADYRCAGCKKHSWSFYIQIDQDCESIMKIGQWPPQSIAVDSGLKKLLGEHVDYFQKGLVCESQSYGIGAFAYYRRIVEEVIDELLEEIANLIHENDREKYVAAIEQTKNTIVASEKIALVKDLLPAILRPGGKNPLSLLHSTLSEGLHDRSDEECLENAESIREVLTFLVTQVFHAKETSKSFTDHMQKLLDRKAKSE